jgi:hypothetical protein
MNQQLRCRLILLGAFFIHAQFLSGQSAHTEYRDLIIQVPGISSSRGFPDIRGKLINVPGVHVIAFCESQQLILMRIEKKKLADNRPVFDAISQLEFKFNVKDGATLQKAMNACKDKSQKLHQYEDLPSE